MGKVRREGRISQYAPRVSGDALQSLREAALRLYLSDDRDVPEARRNSRFQLRSLHWLQGLYAGLSVRFHLHRSG